MDTVGDCRERVDPPTRLNELPVKVTCGDVNESPPVVPEIDVEAETDICTRKNENGLKSTGWDKVQIPSELQEP